MASALSAEQQISAALDAIDAAHEVLRDTPSDVVGNDFRVDVAERLETQNRTNRGLMYRFFGEIADPPDEATSTAQMRAALWQRLRITPGEITRRFKLAARIRPRRSLTGPPVPPELPELAAVVEAGTVGDDHIRAVCRSLDVLPAKVSPTEVAAAERRLVGEAANVDAGIIIRLGQRIADYLNPDGNFSDEDRARRRGLHLGAQGPDGMSRLSGLLDPEARAYFEAIAAAVRPGRHQPEGSDPEARDARTPAQRCHDAFKLGMETAIASGGLGTHRGHPVTVVVTTTLAELDRAAHGVTDPSVPMPAPAHTGGGSWLPMRDLIRMAAESIHYLAVFDDHIKRPLYLGRQKRVATAEQRLICHARDRGCTRPHCLVPGYYCEVHHSPDWARGGRPTPTNSSSPAAATTPWRPAANYTRKSPTAGDSAGPTGPAHPKSTTPTTPKSSSAATPIHPTRPPSMTMQLAMHHDGAPDDGVQRRDHNKIGWQQLVGPYTPLCNEIDGSDR